MPNIAEVSETHQVGVEFPDGSIKWCPMQKNDQTAQSLRYLGHEYLLGSGFGEERPGEYRESRSTKLQFADLVDDYRGSIRATGFGETESLPRLVRRRITTLTTEPKEWLA